MKHYVGLTEESGVIFTGMEVVRRDWTDLARQVQRELYERFFAGRAVDDYLSHTVEALRNGELDATLVYRKALRKDLEDYTAATPPHVAAARKLKSDPGTLIDYVITRNGPEPATERESPNTCRTRKRALISIGSPRVMYLFLGRPRNSAIVKPSGGSSCSRPTRPSRASATSSAGRRSASPTWRPACPAGSSGASSGSCRRSSSRRCRPRACGSGWRGPSCSSGRGSVRCATSTAASSRPARGGRGRGSSCKTPRPARPATP